MTKRISQYGELTIRERKGYTMVYIKRLFIIFSYQNIVIKLLD